jgi:hypothetical protein
LDRMAAVAFVLDRMPPHLQIVMTTRADPLLPLARLRVRASLAEVRAADLRFTNDETADLFQHVHRLDLPSDAMTTLSGSASTPNCRFGLHLLRALLVSKAWAATSTTMTATALYTAALSHQRCTMSTAPLTKIKVLIALWNSQASSTLPRVSLANQVNSTVMATT